MPSIGEPDWPTILRRIYGDDLSGLTDTTPMVYPTTNAAGQPMNQLVRHYMPVGPRGTMQMTSGYAVLPQDPVTFAQAPPVNAAAIRNLTGTRANFNQLLAGKYVPTPVRLPRPVAPYGPRQPTYVGIGQTPRYGPRQPSYVGVGL